MNEEKAKFFIMLMMDGDILINIVENMRQYGGSFVKSLAECISHADAGNLIKLVECFYQYFLDYLPSKIKFVSIADCSPDSLKFFSKKTDTSQN